MGHFSQEKFTEGDGGGFFHHFHIVQGFIQVFARANQAMSLPNQGLTASNHIQAAQGKLLRARKRRPGDGNPIRQKELQFCQGILEAEIEDVFIFGKIHLTEQDDAVGMGMQHHLILSAGGKEMLL